MKSKRVKTLAEKEAIKRYPEVKSKNVGNRFTDLAGAMFENVKVGFSRRGFVEGAEWQKQRDKEWMEAKEKEFKDIRDTTRWVNKSIGYQQGLAAAKLTWEDAQNLWIISKQVGNELDSAKDAFPKWGGSSREMFEEILRRFYEKKGGII